MKWSGVRRVNPTDFQLNLNQILIDYFFQHTSPNSYRDLRARDRIVANYLTESLWYLHLKQDINHQFWGMNLWNPLKPQNTLLLKIYNITWSTKNVIPFCVFLQVSSCGRFQIQLDQWNKIASRCPWSSSVSWFDIFLLRACWRFGFYCVNKINIV